MPLWEKICPTAILILDCTLYSSWELSQKLYCLSGSDLIPLEWDPDTHVTKVLVLTLMISPD